MKTRLAAPSRLAVFPAIFKAHLARSTTLFAELILNIVNISFTTFHLKSGSPSLSLQRPLSGSYPCFQTGLVGRTASRYRTSSPHFQIPGLFTPKIHSHISIWSSPRTPPPLISTPHLEVSISRSFHSRKSSEFSSVFPSLKPNSLLAFLPPFIGLFFKCLDWSVFISNSFVLPSSWWHRTTPPVSSWVPCPGPLSSSQQSTLAFHNRNSPLVLAHIFFPCGSHRSLWWCKRSWRSWGSGWCLLRGVDPYLFYPTPKSSRKCWFGWQHKYSFLCLSRRREKSLSPVRMRLWAVHKSWIGHCNSP